MKAPALTAHDADLITDALQAAQCDDQDAQCLSDVLMKFHGPISFDSALVKRPSAIHQPGVSSDVEQVPAHTDQLAAHLCAAAASLADIARQLALFAAALNQKPAGSGPAPQSVPEGLL